MHTELRQRRLSSLKTLVAGGDGRLADLAREAARRAGLTRRLCERLPLDLRTHVLHASVAADGTATVTVDSAAWANRLHYEQRELLAALSSEGLPAHRVVIRVLPQK